MCFEWLFYLWAHMFLKFNLWELSEIQSLKLNFFREDLCLLLPSAWGNYQTKTTLGYILPWGWGLSHTGWINSANFSPPYPLYLESRLTGESPFAEGIFLSHPLRIYPSKFLTDASRTSPRLCLLSNYRVFIRSQLLPSGIRMWPHS